MVAAKAPASILATFLGLLLAVFPCFEDFMHDHSRNSICPSLGEVSA